MRNDATMIPVAAPRHTTGFGVRFVVPLFMGSMLNPVNSTMIATALVPIAQAYRVSATTTVWLLTGLYLACIVAQPTLGHAADVIGPRRVYVAGLVLVGVAGIIGALNPPFAVLTAVRVLLGIGTSAAYPTAISMIKVQETRLRQPAPGRVLGALAVASMVSLTVGPVLGGFLVGWLGWPSIFLVNTPLALIAILAALRWLPRDELPDGTSRPGAGGDAPHRPGRRGFDLLGMSAFTVTMTALVVLTTSIQWWLIVAVVSLGAAWVIWERRVAHPFLDPRLLAANPPLTLTYIRNGLEYVVNYGVLYGLTEWLEAGRHLSSASAGLVLVPMSMLSALGAAWGARGRRVRVPVLAGAAALLIGTGLLVGVRDTSPVALTIAAVLALGVGHGLSVVGNQAAMYRHAPAGRVAVAAGLLRTVQYLGAILSTSLLTFALGPHITDAGLHRLALTLTALAILLCAVCLADRAIREPHGVDGDPDKLRSTLVSAVWRGGLGRTREGIVLGSAVVAVVVTVIACPIVVGASGPAGIASAWPYPLVGALALIAVGFLVAYVRTPPRPGVSVALWACAGFPLITAAAWLYHYVAHV